MRHTPPLILHVPLGRRGDVTPGRLRQLGSDSSCADIIHTLIPCRRSDTAIRLIEKQVAQQVSFGACVHGMLRFGMQVDVYAPSSYCTLTCPFAPHDARSRTNPQHARTFLMAWYTTQQVLANAA